MNKVSVVMVIVKVTVITWYGESGGKLMKMRMKDVRWRKNPTSTTTSRPRLTKRWPKVKNKSPPNVSPTPRTIPCNPTKLLACDPKSEVNPRADPYTPL
jgi:hypothetical protein